MAASSYNPVSLIRKKRDNEPLSPQEITYLIDAYTAGELPDYQMSAFLMAAFCHTLNDDEAAALTKAMLHSGRVLDLSDIPDSKVDKHSTGGVGDKLSLILAPIVASYGVAVPMISGRGLGHTGGTLDKMEAIPGFDVNISLQQYKRILQQHQMVMAGQTKDIAPADKKLYALRDVTATVESIPLIASSIMSKKLAEGIDALVLDVKFGSGAFMKTQEDALELAQTLVAIGEEFGKQTVAYLTAMEQPLGKAVGNWLEVREAMQALQGQGPADVMEITHVLAGTMLMMGEKAETVDEGIKMSKAAVQNGQAFDKWCDLTEAQGGDAGVLKNPDSYEAAPHTEAITATGEGYITQMYAYKVGMASLELGAGRKTKEDAVDPKAGIMLQAKVGTHVKQGDVLATCYTSEPSTIPQATELLADAFTLGDEKPSSMPPVTHKVDKDGSYVINKSLV